MAGPKRRAEFPADQPRPDKLPKLPSGVTTQKRPLLHPPIPSPASSASTQKVIYVSAKTPFLSAVNRVKKLLAQVEKRETQSALKKGQKSKSGRWNKRPEDVVAAAADLSVDRGETEEIVIKGSGRAISKTLDLAVFFQERDEYWVRMSTSSVAAIDDIVVDETKRNEKRKADGDENGKDSQGAEEVEGAYAGEKNGDPLGDLPDSRIRWISVLEVYVSLR